MFTQKNTIKFLWLATALLIIIWKGFIPGWKDKPADFNNYYVSARLVVEGEAISQFYNNDWFSEQAKGFGIKDGAKFSPFPPITAYAMIPLTLWNPINAKRIWLIINTIILILLPISIKKITSWSFIQAALFLSIFSIPIASNLNFGQVYLFITYFLVVIIGQYYQKHKSVLIGLIIGLTGALKYVPILFLGYVIKHQKSKAIFLWVGLSLFLSIFVIYIIDPKSIFTFFQQFGSHVQGDLSGQGKYAIGFQSIDSLLNNLFVTNLVQNPNPIINLAILKTIFKWLLVGMVGGTLLLLYKKSDFVVSRMFVSIGILGSFILLPASASYHFLLLILPILYIYSWLIATQTIKVLYMITILFLATFSIQSFMIPLIPQFPTINLLIHYPRFWGLLCLFLVVSFYYFKDLSKKHG